MFEDIFINGIFIIRGGFFGFDWTHKLFYLIGGIALCIYDWKKNKRKDYFWVYLFGVLLYVGSEVMLFLFGGRVMQDKLLFGMDITSMPWLWIPVMAIGDVVVLGVMALFLADRIRNPETRRKWILIFVIWLLLRDVLPYVFLYISGSSFASISIGDPLIFSRRNMIETGTIMALSTIIIITLIWFLRTNRESRQRGLYMIGVMLIMMTVWSCGEWLAGQRWIEVGPESGPWTLAPPLLSGGMFAYDIVIEMGLFTASFLAFPSLFKLIKSRERLKEVD